MIPNLNLSEARSESISPGAYIMKVKDVEVDTKYNRLVLLADICEGEKAGYYERLNERAGFWGMRISLYMDEKSRWKFAKSIDAFMESNNDFNWNYDGENDERKLVNKVVGVVTRLKEYYGNDGQKKSKIVPYSLISVNDVRSGNYTIPDPIRLEADAFSGEVVDTTAGFEDIKTDDVPF